MGRHHEVVVPRMHHEVHGRDGLGQAVPPLHPAQKEGAKKIFFLWRPSLPDPKDDMVLELAVASRAQYIVTYNGRTSRRQNVLASRQ